MLTVNTNVKKIYFLEKSIAKILTIEIFAILFSKKYIEVDIDENRIIKDNGEEINRIANNIYSDVVIQTNNALIKVNGDDLDALYADERLKNILLEKVLQNNNNFAILFLKVYK